ncbi:MAG: glutamine--fructose-6-phosphate transaminase (isomerizing) [Floccifex porci]|uniref:glutamine--fructose-6-phosphate transaminase (isomerizing) n=1 Tax=Floccifex porci TaxID=2606629 RepID=UPI0023EF8434|nr:glutamine--fructose-6-phosphate transaminase (isomerizing) [Floccifex porci]MDD7467224.1 glutamine--fructose-6-phosphate transaminase (isomerizing) [Floccifex porci]MDY4796528.1 glutamine--fructose-6-phosphate transaminase (isomerizing) [Floccifex porci]
MCGIVGFNGNQQAAPVLLEGLSKLEYRGYDSAGIAVFNQNEVEIVKAKGRLKSLMEKTNDGQSVNGTCGIGHTRWATHGEPSEDNAHPHISFHEKIVTVHNGIIENYQELKDRLLKEGYIFYSQTDTEVATNLIEFYYLKNKDPLKAISEAMMRIRGSYALAVMFKDYSDQIFVARKDSPMILGVSNQESYIASDVPAILKYTRNVYYIGNLEMACLKKGSISFYNLDGEEIEKECQEIKWDAQAAEKGGYEHFMMKEIHEQPKAVEDTLNSIIKDNQIVLDLEGLDISNLSQIHFVACGSAWHVSMACQYIFEDLTHIPVRVELASEFRYRNPLLSKKDLVIVISQSGETADSLAALRLAKEKGIPTLAIVNVLGSSIAREADYVLYTLAGPEISVATTKAYSAQLVLGYVLAIYFGKEKGLLEEEKVRYYLSELNTLPKKIERVLEDKERLQWFASKYSNAKDVFFIGRGIDYAISLEGSLKLKEISYIHSEAYAAGELKHGAISLIEDGTLLIGVCTQSQLYEKTISNMVECKSRGAYLMAVAPYGYYQIEDTANFTTYIPRIDEHFIGSLAVIPLQLLAYYLSVSKGLDVDKPRNLAKSVTVE